MSTLPEGWIETCLGEVLTPIKRSAKPDTNSNMLFVGMDSIEANSTKVSFYGKFSEMKSQGNLFYEGEVLYGRMRPYLNKVHKAVVNGVCSGEFIIFKQSKAIGADFIVWLLHSKEFVRFASRNSSGDRPRVGFDDDLSPYRFLLPPLNEQRRIVEKIEELFSKIDAGEAALKKAQALLKQYRQSLLKAAVTGDLTHEWREKNKGKIEPAHKLLERILKVRRNAFNGKGKYRDPMLPNVSTLPQLPDGWVWAALDQVSDITGGVTVDGKRKVEDGITVPYLRVANVQRGYLDLSEIKNIHVDKETALKLSLKKGDILFNEGGDLDKLGRGWIWSGEVEMCIHQNHIFALENMVTKSHQKSFLGTQIF